MDEITIDKIKQQKKEKIRDYVTKVLHSNENFHTIATEQLVAMISLELYYSPELVKTLIDVIIRIQELSAYEFFINLIASSKYPKDDERQTFSEEIRRVLDFYHGNAGSIRGIQNSLDLYNYINTNNPGLHDKFIGYFFKFYLKGSTSMRYLIKEWNSTLDLPPPISDSQLNENIGKKSDWDFNLIVNPWIYTGPVTFNDKRQPEQIINIRYYPIGTELWTKINDKVTEILYQILWREDTLLRIDEMFRNVFRDENFAQLIEQLNSKGSNPETDPSKNNHPFKILGSWRSVHPDGDFKNIKIALTETEEDNIQITNSEFSTTRVFFHTQRWGFTLFRLLNTFPAMTIRSNRDHNVDGIRVPDLDPYYIAATGEHIDISVIRPTTYRWTGDIDSRRGLGTRLTNLQQAIVHNNAEIIKEWSIKWMDPPVIGEDPRNVSDISNKEFFLIWEHTVNTFIHPIKLNLSDGATYMIPLYITSVYGILEDLDITIKERGGSLDKKFPSRMRRVKLFQRLLCTHKKVMRYFLEKHKPTYPGQELNVKILLDEICDEAMNNLICPKEDIELQNTGVGPILRGFDIKDYSEKEKKFIFDIFKNLEIDITTIQELLYYAVLYLIQRESQYTVIAPDGTEILTEPIQNITIPEQKSVEFYISLRKQIMFLTNPVACIMFSNLIREYHSMNDEHIQNTIVKVFIVLLDIYWLEKLRPVQFIEAFRYLIYFYYERRNHLISKLLMNEYGNRIHLMLLEFIDQIKLSEGSQNIFLQIFGGANLSLLLGNGIQWTNDLDYRVHTFNISDYRVVVNFLIRWLLDIAQKLNTIGQRTWSENQEFDGGKFEVVIYKEAQFYVGQTLLQLHYVLPNFSPKLRFETASNNRAHFIEIYINDYSRFPPPITLDNWKRSNIPFLIQDGGVFYYNSNKLIFEFAKMLVKNLSIMRLLKYDKRLKQLIMFRRRDSHVAIQEYSHVLKEICFEMQKAPGCVNPDFFIAEGIGYETYKFLEKGYGQAIIEKFLNYIIYPGISPATIIREFNMFNETYLKPFANDIFFPFDRPIVHQQVDDSVLSRAEMAAQTRAMRPREQALHEQRSALGRDYREEIQRAAMQRQLDYRRQRAVDIQRGESVASRVPLTLQEEDFPAEAHMGAFMGGCKNFTKKKCSKKKPKKPKKPKKQRKLTNKKRKSKNTKKNKNKHKSKFKKNTSKRKNKV